MEKKKRLNIDIDGVTYGKLKAIAARRGITLSVMVRRMLFKYLIYRQKSNF